MDINDWKRFKRSGAFRNKVKNKYRTSLAFTCNVTTGDTSTNQESEVNVAKGSVQNNNAMVSVSHPANIVCVHNTTGTSTAVNSEDITASTAVNDSDLSCSDFSENEDDFTEDKDEEFRNSLKKWAIDSNIPHEAVKSLSEIINKRLANVLPKDPRTLLNTCTTISIIPLGAGHYWHNGLANVLKKYLSILPEVPDNISLNINIDGLPVYKSSKHQLWPILCNIHEEPKVPPFAVGIYAGQGKPSDLNSYLRMFVDEMKEVLEKGLEFKKADGTQRTIGVTMRAFICDSPARAFIKGVCSFNGKEGCLKCTTLGEYTHTSHKVIFPRINCPKRNNNDFRAKKYGGHHKTDSLLLELPIDMVEDFVVGDSLHLVDLGIMKRLLTGWRDGSFGKFTTKWCSRDIDKVSNFLLKCKTPKEIHRSTRGLDNLAHWKGNEYRTFLYYLSFVILQYSLSSDAYQHFLCFFCAITICSNENYFHFLELANSLLNWFIETYRDFYGEDYMTSNVHNLTHVVDEVKRFGKLQSFSSYPFENQLYTLKKMIRKGDKPLAQIARRISEKIALKVQTTESDRATYPVVKMCRTKLGTKPVLYLKQYLLSPQEVDKWFLSNENHIIELISLESNADNIIIYGNRIETPCDVFDTPIKSSYLNIYKCDCSDMKKTRGTYEINSIKCKLVAICHESIMYYIPLLHTL